MGADQKAGATADTSQGGQHMSNQQTERSKDPIDQPDSSDEEGSKAGTTDRTFSELSTDELELVHFLLREFGAKGDAIGATREDLQQDVFKEVMRRRVDRLGEDNAAQQQDATPEEPELTNAEREDLARRIVDRFRAGLDVSEDAWEFAESSDEFDEEFDTWFDLYEDTFEEDVSEVSEMTRQEKKEAKEEYFKERIENTQLSYRIHTCQISDATGRKAFVAIEENRLLQFVDVTVHKTYNKMIDHFTRLGRVHYG
jgi:hypothetical protein